MNIHPRHPHNVPEAINEDNQQPLQALNQANAQNGVIQVLQEQPADMQAALALAQPDEDRLNVLLCQQSDDEEELLNVLKQMTSSAISVWKTPQGTSLWESIFVCGRPSALQYCLEQLEHPSEDFYQNQLKNYIKQHNSLNYYDSCMMPKGIHSLKVVKAMLQAILQGLVSIYNKTEEELKALVEEGLPKSTLYSISSTQTKKILMALITDICEQKRCNYSTKSSRCVS